MHFPYSFTVTVTHFTENGDGDWIFASSEVISGCAVSPNKRSFETSTYLEDTVRADLTLFAPSGSNISSTDRVTLPDETVWDVWGYGADYASPFTGWAPGMQVPLRRYQG